MKMVSGLAQKLGQKVRYEVEWAHHWLGKEFDANPVAFNQLKIGQFMMGEADIILNCSKPEEIRARLRLMCRLGYWQTRYEWTSVRNVYAAIMHGIETGREDWQFDSWDYEDMLVLNTNRTAQSSRDDRPKRPWDFFYCGPFQCGKCQLDSPRMAKVGADGVEHFVYHVCSSCLVKEGKKLNHASNSTSCPQGRNN